MKDLPAEEAIARSRSRLDLPESVPGRAWLTRRLDRVGKRYYLVILGEPERAVGVAAVDAETGEIDASARLSGLRPHLTVEAEEARKRAGLAPPVEVELVWQPSRASRSPLYPLWEVRSPAATVYVDGQGRVWTELEPASPGG